MLYSERLRRDHAAWIISPLFRIKLQSRCATLLSGEPDYFGRNEISSGGDLSHYSSASLY